MRSRLLVLCSLIALAACAQEASPSAFEEMAPTTEASEDVDAELFTDPQSTYTMQVDPDWTALPGTLVEEIEVWKVGPTKDGFTPNVNVLTQRAPNLDLENYVELSRRSADNAGLEVLEATIVEGADGQELGVMDYTGRQGPVDLHFLGVFSLKDDRAVVATLTAPPDTFDQLATDVRPLLLTLVNT